MSYILVYVLEVVGQIVARPCGYCRIAYLGSAAIMYTFLVTYLDFMSQGGCHHLW